MGVDGVALHGWGSKRNLINLYIYENANQQNRQLKDLSKMNIFLSIYL